MDYQKITAVFQPLSEENGVKILLCLRQKEKNLAEVCAASGLTQADAADTLQKLIAAGLAVTVRNPDDAEDYYAISPFGSYGAVNLLREVLSILPEDGSPCCNCGGCN